MDTTTAAAVQTPETSTPEVLSPEAVAALWAEVLGLARLGPDEPLADYGPDSLDAARVMARLRRSGHEVPFRAVFGAVTARELAGQLTGGGAGPAARQAQEARPAREATTEVIDVAAGGDGGPGGRGWPLSHDQQRLWLLDQQGQGGAPYHLPVILRLRGELDRAALRRAWGDLVARHESLRTRFVLAGHEPRQEVLASWPAAPDEVRDGVYVEVDLDVDPTAASGDVPDAELMATLAELTARPFDLAAAPPWRAVLYRLGATEHVLALVIHHILFDGWSEQVLRRELSASYAARRDGRPARLPELAVTYAQHASRQRRQPVSEEQLRYWRGQLAGSTQLDLPAAQPRPADPHQPEGGEHDFVIDPRLTAGMRALARTHRVTPFMTLLAVWSALLGRLCDTHDVVVGASTADRDRPELEGVIGMFVNVLVIRTGLAAGLPAAELLATVRETTLDAFANREVPFERLVAELAPDRAAGHNPLFNVNFVYLNMPPAGEQWPDLRVRQLRPPVTDTAFDLIFAVQDRPDGSLGCHLEYRTALLDAATVELIGRCFRRLLAGFAAAPDTPLDRLPILEPAERAALLAGSVAPAAPAAALPPGGCLHTVVQWQAERAPAAVAVACGGVELTYAELDARANRLANYLCGQGVGPEVGVAVRLPRSADQVVAMLAVWRAGGYYLPMDDEHPAERIAQMLADAAPLVLVTRGAERIASGEAAGEIKVTCLDRDAVDIAGQPATPPLGVTVGPDGLAAAIFTSGSTGAPKAVALTHRNVLSAQAGRVAFGAPPRSLLLPVSFAFDVFLSFAAWTLCAGGRLVIPVQPRGADLDELAELLRAHRVTHLVGPPDLQRALLAMDRVRGVNELVIGVVGGQSCPGVLAEDYAAATAGARLVNEYGLTETSAGTWFVTDGRDGVAAARQLPIGRPADGYRVYLLDTELEPVPPGVPGEVYVGGPGVARGYLGRPALTAGRFVPDPFGAGAPGSGGRLYRTGDLARRRGDGTLEFLGRRDQQVKVRGHRIELAEVETALLRHGSVDLAAVVYQPQRQELVAYVVGGAGADGTGGARPSGAELREHLCELLPEPMVPAAFGVLTAMPLTPNGKIDRAALAALDVHELAAEPAAPHLAARTPAERTVAEVWGEVMELDPAGIDVHADFFRIGGHSLLAAGVVSRLRARFPVPITMADLFGAPTVAGLADLVATRAAERHVGVPASDGRALGRPGAGGDAGAAAAERQVGVPALDPRAEGRPGGAGTAGTAEAAGEAGTDAGEPWAAWNDTGRDYRLAPLNRTLAEQARRTPDAPAVWAQGRWLSYAEFGAGVHRLAAHLRGAGAGVDGVVGVCLPRGGPMVTAVHAAIAAGAAYLPLPPDQPAARLAAMIEDARPVLVVTTADLAGKLGGVRLVCLDRDAAAIAAEPSDPSDQCEQDVPLDALAYVIFTSGSTGRPKGVGVSHRAIANRLVWMQETFPLTPADRVLHKTPFSFDVSVWELFWPLLTGAGMVVADDERHRDFDHLADLAAATGVTTVHFVPSMLAMFLDEPGAAARLGSVRRVVCSGEALTADLVDRCLAALPGAQLHNLYGPTEAAVDVSWHPCRGGEAVVPIGRPVANTRLEVLDVHGARVPVGEPGELCIGGVQLARGYLGRPALTAQRFVPDPFAARPGERLYRTGDLARWRPDGTVEYLGRLDHQVKIRGVRIEPAEIEAALRRHPAVVAAAVLPWRQPGGEVRLAGYLVPAPGVAAPTAARLREFLRDELPDALVPARFVVLPVLPLTASGKLDRRALPAPSEGWVPVHGPAVARGDALLVWLRREGGGEPLLCVHPGDGAVHWYADLAAAAGRPLAALRWPDRHDGSISIEAVALRYLAELRAARPRGPYHLLGWCGGTPVTWELARLLDAAGEQVRLWLLDPLVDVARRTETVSQLALLRESEALFDPSAGAGQGDQVQADPVEAANRRADLVATLRISAGPGVPATEDEVRRQIRAGRELLEAGIAYEYRPYPGRVGLLIGDEVPTEVHVVMGGQGYQQYLARWRELATGGVDLHRVPGGHYDVLRAPQVATLAGLLGGELVRP